MIRPYQHLNRVAAAANSRMSGLIKEMAIGVDYFPAQSWVIFIGAKKYRLFQLDDKRARYDFDQKPATGQQGQVVLW